ncbi:hypothetical protein BJ878DRAFT_481811 [Calycina marina]|uniref:Uncharacterized protein n=1 Tax=Calycina marina TaxID=1763456 RepID=A0A9P7YZQ2_9HELO|nr:hypothetical protein BJ878DRAFT_481811 [Calycina marina]
MFQKAGWHFKRLVSHRSHASLEDIEIPSDTWIPELPVRRKQSESTKYIINSAQLSKGSGAYSSATSLCSCDSKSLVPACFSLSTSTTSQINPAVLCHLKKPPSSTNVINDQNGWRFATSENLALANPSSRNVNDGLPPGFASYTAPFVKEGRQATAMVLADLDEQLPASPNSGKQLATGPKFSTGLADDTQARKPGNVDLLIQEADNAFQDVGDALPQQTSGELWYDISSTKQHTNRPSLPQTSSRKQLHASGSTKSSIARGKSGSKSRPPVMSKKQKEKQKSPASIDGKGTMTKRNSRWTNYSGMVGALSDKLFRTEVDEMLSSKEMERLRHEIRAQRLPMDMEEMEQHMQPELVSPTTPFSPDSLSRRVSFAASKRSTTPISPMTSNFGSAPPIMPPKSTSHAARSSLDDAVVSGDSIKDDDDDDLNFPPPPRKSINRPFFRATEPLPTIHEQGKLMKKVARPTLFYTSTPSEIKLRSTRFTLTSLLYRHGSIVIENRGLKREDVGADDLDWTAFQMAISGSTAEGYAAEDTELQYDRTEEDDIIEWWEQFGLELGELVRENLKPRLPDTDKKADAVELPCDKIKKPEESNTPSTKSPVTRSPVTPQIGPNMNKVVAWDIF